VPNLPDVVFSHCSRLPCVFVDQELCIVTFEEALSMAKHHLLKSLLSGEASNSSRYKAGKPRFIPMLTTLEDRTVPAVINVTTLADTVAVDGTVSLREAIQSINASANINADVTASGYGSFDQIRFTGLSGTITLTSNLDAITKQVAVSGNTGAGFAGKPVITVDGVTSFTTFTITGPSVTIANLAIVRSNSGGITISGSTATGAIIQGNHIGIDASGTTAQGNSIGINIKNGATGALIGGIFGQDGNVISGNNVTISSSGQVGTEGGRTGIFISGSGTANHIIRGNLIGTDVTGKVRVQNTSGINIENGASNVTIGGSDPNDRNVISGNSGGIGISTGTSGNTIQGNLIGTDITGTTALGNSGLGIFISGTGNTVGGTTAGTGNVIANNGVGVLITTVRNQPGVPQGNQVLGNSIFSNTSLGIDLGATGVTANDNLDADTGPNQLQNYPVITSVVGSQIFGSLHSTPGSVFRLEFFSNTARDPSGFGEGQTYLGFLDVSTDSRGNAPFTFNAPSSLVGLYVSATATLGGTSEFGNAVLGIPTPSLVPLLVPSLIPPRVPRPQPVPVLNTPLVPPGVTPVVTAGNILPTAGDNSLQPKAALVVGAGLEGSSVVVIYNGDGTERGRVNAFPGFFGGVRVAAADVNNDGHPDIIAAAGVKGAPHVKVFDGVTGAEIRSFFAYDTSFTGGVFVAGGDLNGDGFAEIITGAGAGGGPHVKVFDGATGLALVSFFAYAPEFGGGVSVSAGDFNNDGLVEVVTGAGSGAGHVLVLEGTSINQILSNGMISNTAILRSFFAYGDPFMGGVFVTTGADFNEDGFVDIVTGAGAGGGPHVRVIDGQNGSELASFFAFDQNFQGGVRVGEADALQDGVNELVLGAGPGGGPAVQVRKVSGLIDINDFFAFDPAFIGGVFVD
jgi:trimeric autotransporter adhesin